MEMKQKLIPLVCIPAFFALSANAQVVIINDNILQGRMSEIKTVVLDSLTNEPVSFASVYLIPSKDTVITNFTLTDAKGEAKLDEVPYGSYVFRVEMMGYKPFSKERYFGDRQVDMGTVKLTQDERFLQAAVVSDVGNPIVVKQDTVEFNASSFRVGANAMLKDLLERMPGMEITEEGKVKFNGEAIDKLTVGGRTFFFNDQSTALNNLPAAVVDKIRVIDRESEQARATGVQDAQREKVLDVGLKKEYEQGWFGNVGLKGGTTLAKEDEDNPLRSDRGLLWNGNALASAYGKEDQVTLIANGQNIEDSNAMVFVIDESGERSGLNQGLSTAAQLGVNANTSRIKDVETTVSANYKYSDTDSGTKAERTTYQDDGNLLSSSEKTGKQYANSLKADMEFTKEEGNLWFHIRPSMSYGKIDSFSRGASETWRSGAFANSSSTSSSDRTVEKSADINADFTFRELGGKTGRNVQISVDAAYDKDSGESDETTELTLAGGRETRAMSYSSDGHSYNLEASLSYTEPLGEKWKLSSSAEFDWTKSKSIRDAFDAGGRNDYYSSESRNDYLKQKYDLSAQYKMGRRSWITLGGSVIGVQNEVFSKSYGIEDTNGRGEWLWSVTPTLSIQHTQGKNRLNFAVYGYNQRPASSRMLPVLNISDPSRLSLGNVYLKSSTQTYFSTYWTRNDRERFSTLMVFLSGSLTARPTTYARWYDTDGILYSLPVNSRKPNATSSLTVNYTTPLDAGKKFSLTLNGAATCSSSVNYQSKTTLSALDKDSFDYSAFMAEFWGNAAGDRFYGGLSGFEQSRTLNVSPSAGFTVKYNRENYSFSAGASTKGRLARYSLDPSINMNTLDTRIKTRASYTTEHEFEFITDLSYVFYNGYAEGYGQPEWQWNAEISKRLGAFSLSIKMRDILNQTRSLTHTVTANYVEDSYRLIMGRYVLFGVKWNFGKMNADHSRRAQQAAMNMVF